MKIINAKVDSTNLLERQDQNESIEVAFTVTNILREQGEGGYFTMKVRFPFEAGLTSDVEIPSSHFRLDGNTVKWNVKSNYTFYTGYIQTQLFYHKGDVVATDSPYDFKVPYSLRGSETPPDVYVDWQEAIEVELAGKQDQLIAGDNITIEGNVISATGGGGGASSWDDLTGKPFNSIGQNLKVEQGVLKVDTTNNAERDNTQPITSAGTYVILGNIDSLLEVI